MCMHCSRGLPCTTCNETECAGHVCVLGKQMPEAVYSQQVQVKERMLQKAACVIGMRRKCNAHARPDTASRVSFNLNSYVQQDL